MMKYTNVFLNGQRVFKFPSQTFPKTKKANFLEINNWQNKIKYMFFIEFFRTDYFQPMCKQIWLNCTSIVKIDFNFQVKLDYRLTSCFRCKTVVAIVVVVAKCPTTVKSKLSKERPKHKT